MLELMILGCGGLALIAGLLIVLKMLGFVLGILLFPLKIAFLGILSLLGIGLAITVLPFAAIFGVALCGALIGGLVVLIRAFA